MEIVKDFKKAVSNIRNELKKYLTDNNLKALVLGLSGGIDSALCAALAYDVCIKNNIEFIGRSIAIESNKPDENKRGTMIGECYVTNYKHVDLTNSYLQIRNSLIENFESENFEDFGFKLRMGNIKARMRMIYLYELASKHKGMVLSTDNLTELLLGFWTLHGDVGDYGMIQQLWKTEVYQMSEYIAENEANEKQKSALKACINAVPTDGLGITNSDLDQLKASSYKEVDEILIDYLINKNNKYENHPVIQRHLKSEFKRKIPINLKREVFF